MQSSISSFTKPNQPFSICRNPLLLILGRSEKYPFSKLEIGQAFVIPVSENHPEPWKSLQSTVSGAQRRFATVDGEKTRRNRKTGTEKTIQNWVPTRKFRLYEIKLEDGSSAAAVKRIA